MLRLQHILCHRSENDKRPKPNTETRKTVKMKNKNRFEQKPILIGILHDRRLTNHIKIVNIFVWDHILSYSLFR